MDGKRVKAHRARVGHGNPPITNGAEVRGWWRARQWGAERDAQQARLNTLHRGNPARAKAALDDPDLEARVLAEEAQAWDMNISGVPAMIVEGKFLIPGAQSPETYVTALRRVAERGL